MYQKTNNLYIASMKSDKWVDEGLGDLDINEIDTYQWMNEWMNRCVYRWMMNAWTNDWRNREIQSNNTALKAFVANLKSTGTSQIETLVLE